MKSLVDRFVWLVLTSSLVFSSMVDSRLKLAECPSGCDVERCSCSEDETGGTFVTCEGLSDSFALCLDINVIEFHLHRSNITSLSPTDFRNATNLQVVDITENFKLETIEEFTFRELTKLQQIYLNHNALAALEKRIFPTDAALEEIRLNNNKINRILHENVFSGLERSLKHLRLGFNKLEEFNCPRLHELLTLELAENRLRDLKTTMFHECPNVVEIILSGNLIKELTVSWEPLRALHTLDLNDNEIREVDQGFHVSLPGLRYLFLAFNDLRSIPRLPKNLLGLMLSGNRFETIRNFTFENHTHLAFLDISDVQDLVEVEEFAFAGLRSLSRLTLSYNRKLSSLPPNLLAESREINELRLESNNISIFHRSFFENLDGLWSAVISGNPIHCSCDNSWIRVEMENHENYWIQPWKNGTRAVICRTPGNLENFLISQLNDYDLTCSLSRMAEHSMTTTGDGAILQAVLVEGVPNTSWYFPDGRHVFAHRQTAVQLQEDPRMEEILWDNLTILARLTLGNRGDFAPGQYVLEWTNAGGSDNFTFTFSGSSTPSPPGGGSNTAAIVVTIMSLAMVVLFVVGGVFLHRYLKSRRLNPIQPSDEEPDNMSSSDVQIQNEPAGSSLLTPTVGYGSTTEMIGSPFHVK